MLNLPKISIITPSYNQGEFLERCIDSVLYQNYPNLEYIIMDGGSSDNSAEIIKRYEKHLAYWQSRPDGGHYSAVQEGFNLATGDIMGWLNSDDMFHQNGLFIVGNTFAQNAEVELITGKRVGFDGEGNLLSYGHEKQTWCRNRLLDQAFVDMHVFVMQEATFWRRSLWEKAGATLDLSFDLAADFELWLRFSRYARMYTVDALLAGYRYYGASQRSQLGREEYIAQCKRAIVRERQMCSEIFQYDAVPAPLIECRQSDTPLQMLVSERLTLQAERQALQAQVRALQAQVQALQAERQALQAEGQALQTQVQTLQVEGQALQAERQALQTQKVVLTARQEAFLNSRLGRLQTLQARIRARVRRAFGVGRP